MKKNFGKQIFLILAPKKSWKLIRGALTSSTWTSAPKSQAWKFQYNIVIGIGYCIINACTSITKLGKKAALFSVCFCFCSDLWLYIFSIYTLFSSRSSHFSPLFFEMFISHLFGLLMRSVAKCISLEIVSSLRHLIFIFVAAFRQ